ncbi:MAG: exodeoxyribonuclease VII large subunit [Candidatus Azobacteroides sp.]|nr:exodeoxyribonuclease VII large subunit [Candidatus Azobacteroides sp.]
MIDELTVPSYFSLSEINLMVKDSIRQQFPSLYWLKAEISEMKVNASGHCYLEFIEKDPYSGRLSAKAQGKIWANTFRLIRPYFEKETGQVFTSGLKVLVQVSVDFHEIYGYSFTVSDIDPAFTVGEMMQHRHAVIKQLEEDGVLTLNKELDLAPLPTRIAVISSKTASGYEDFENQIRLQGNRFNFSIKLFPAVMQGVQTEESIIKALNRIYDHYHQYDVVVIIRGGGATSDLSCFDSYLLAANCAQFPLPIITGIGHEKDNSVVDVVAHTRVKTPTAAANFLIDKITAAENELLYLENAIYQHLSHSFLIEKNRLSTLSSSLSLTVNQLCAGYISHLERIEQRMGSSLSTLFSRQNYKINLFENTLKLAAPENILKKGYTLTLHQGKIVKSPTGLKKGEVITTRFFDGNVESEIK